MSKCKECLYNQDDVCQNDCLFDLEYEYDNCLSYESIDTYYKGYQKGRNDAIDECKYLFRKYLLTKEIDGLDELLEELKQQNKLSCFDCKNHFMSDCYLECNKHNRINDNKICDDFEQLKE